MKRVLTSSWLAMSAGGLTFLVTMMWLLQSAAPLVATHAEPEAKEETVTMAFANPEIDQLMAELRSRGDALNQRETQLREFEARLAAERAEIAVVTQSVQELQKEFDQNVTRVREEEAPNLKKLARMYSNMEPSAAIPMLKQLDDRALVKLLVCMKETEASAILEQFAKPTTADARHAAELADRLRMAIVDGKKK